MYNFNYTFNDTSIVNASCGVLTQAICNGWTCRHVMIADRYYTQLIIGEYNSLNTFFLPNNSGASMV